MKWKCDNCGKMIEPTGEENKCPECSAKVVFRCVKCGKELDNGKNKYCPSCRMQKEETQEKVVKAGIGIGGLVVTGGLFLLRLLGGKGGNKS